MWPLVVKHFSIMSIAVVPAVWQAAEEDGELLRDLARDVPALVIMAVIVWLFLRHMDRNANGGKRG